MEVAENLLSSNSTSGNDTASSSTFTSTAVTNNNANPLKVVLTADSKAAFYQDDTLLGYGETYTKIYNPSSTFSGYTYRCDIGPNKANVYYTISRILIDVKNDKGVKIATTEALEQKMYVYNPNKQSYLLTDTKQFSSNDTITLNFAGIILTPPSNNQLSYQIRFGSNFNPIFQDKLKLKADLYYLKELVSTNTIPLGTSTDLLKSSELTLAGGVVSFSIIGDIPEDYSLESVRWANATIANAKPNPTDVTWQKGSKFFEVKASELLSGRIDVAAEFKKINAFAPTLYTTLKTTTNEIVVSVKNSDKDKMVEIPYEGQYFDEVVAYVSQTKIVKGINTSNRIDDKTKKVYIGGSIKLDFKRDFDGIYGRKKIILVSSSNAYGTGAKVEMIVNFKEEIDFPSITKISSAKTIDVPAFSDLNISFDVIYETKFATSVDVDLLAKDKTRIPLFKKLSPKGTFKINLRDLATKFSTWNGSTFATLIFRPINNGGATPLVGNEYESTTNIIYPTIQLDTDKIRKSMYDAFLSNLSFDIEKENKYLTHLSNFGNNEQILISSWEEDDFTLSKKSLDTFGNTIVKTEDVVESIILKLYSPLPASIEKDSTFWITKLLTNPLIETVILNQQDTIQCPPLKGPNFNIDVDFITGNSTNFESIDTLILSGSTSSAQLVNKYLSSSLIDTEDLNIQFTNGFIVGEPASYLWENFVHFSSAKERVDNFVYKVQLIELYENLIISSSTNYTNGNTGYYTGSISSLQEIDRQTVKKNEIIQGFDGFEKFLYTSSSYSLHNSSSITWPYSGSVRVNSTSPLVTNNYGTGWYDNIITLAEDFDISNPNWVQNNIPQYVLNDTQNESLLLFFSMIGHHFDTIYYHTKAIEKSRGLGYSETNGISDKLLFNTLKSFSWDARNIASDNKLWNLVFGFDEEGNKINEKSAKKRNTEVWRRIVNNLPYLLKNKGTRKGIYAIMACYGIPASNLSILEFGGPEVTDEIKSKLVIDNITTALKMTNTSSIEMDWKHTDKGRVPNTVELFAKPAYSGDWMILSGSGWNVEITGQNDSNYGRVVFNYNNSNSITSPLLPLFNGRFFGISVSSGSAGLRLDLRQSEKERTIFSSSMVATGTTNWNTQGKLKLGGDYIGSVDEFRLWNEQLNTNTFYEHVSFPEMVTGNSISSSTHDLYLRLDFEYPKNLSTSKSILNVANNIFYPKNFVRNKFEETGSIVNITSTLGAPISASANGFTSIDTYPHNFEVIDRTIVMDYPDGGASRFSNSKVRFESQYDLSGNDVINGINLSSKSRATKKSFDQAPTDSNRVGLFFSPTKELNIDIAKSFGGLNIDNYIGDPSDDYKNSYKKLDDLRHYYFQRFDGRDIYAYINLIKLYEKSMFEDIKKMLPARVKATTGLLIEPHILERSKVAHKKPTGVNNQLETIIDSNNTTNISAETNQYQTIIDANLSDNLFAENYQYNTRIDINNENQISADNYQYNTTIRTTDNTNISSDYYQQTASIDCGLQNPTILTEIDLYDLNIVAGQSTFETIGFGIYAQNGHAIRTYFDERGRRVKERIKVDLITEQKSREALKYKIVINGKGDPRGGMELTSSIYYETKLNIQPYSTAKVINAGTGSIVQVKKVDGYLPTHYRNTSDLTRGLQNSFFRGSKNTAATTIDGASPIETFISNPNILTVNKAGRNTSEPILEVE